MRESIGFVGLGQMGQPIAFNLLRAIGADHDLRVFDVQETPGSPARSWRGPGFPPGGCGASWGTGFEYGSQ